MATHCLKILQQSFPIVVDGLPCGIEQHSYLVIGQTPKVQIGLRNAYATCPLVYAYRMFHTLITESFL